MGKLVKSIKEFIAWTKKLEGGLTKYALGNYEGAISDYDKAIKFNPQLADAYYNRGLSKSALRDDQGAKKDFTTALKLDPNLKKNGSN